MFDKTKEAITTGNQWFVEKPALEVSMTAQLTMLAIMSAFALATIWFAISEARRMQRSYPLWLCVGAGFAAFYEPLGDFLAHVTYHEVNSLQLTTAYGFSVPLWVLPCYVIFFGCPVLYFMRKIEDGIAMKEWMTFFFLSVLGAWLWEMPIIHLGFTDYYGANQPVKLLGYPVWMGFVNTATAFIATALLYHIKDKPVFRDRPILFAVIFPALVAGCNVGPGLPFSSAINSTDNVLIVNAAATFTVLLSIYFTWICGTLVVKAKDAGAASAVPGAAIPVNA